MDDRDAAFECVDGSVEIYFLAVEQNLTEGRLLDPREDFHQRGLACAVLPEKRGNPATANREVDAGECLGDAEVLPDVHGFENDVGIEDRLGHEGTSMMTGCTMY